jgi:hypothetical protein
MNTDKESLEAIEISLKECLTTCYLIESIASYKLEYMLEKSIQEITRLKEKGEI